MLAINARTFAVANIVKVVRRVPGLERFSPEAKREAHAPLPGRRDFWGVPIASTGRRQRTKQETNLDFSFRFEARSPLLHVDILANMINTKDARYESILDFR